MWCFVPKLLAISIECISLFSQLKLYCDSTVRFILRVWSSWELENFVNLTNSRFLTRLHIHEYKAQGCGYHVRPFTAAGLSLWPDSSVNGLPTEKSRTRVAALPPAALLQDCWVLLRHGSNHTRAWALGLDFQPLASAQIHSSTTEIIVLVVVGRSKSSPSCWISLGDQKT